MKTIIKLFSLSALLLLVACQEKNGQVSLEPEKQLPQVEESTPIEQIEQIVEEEPIAAAVFTCSDGSTNADTVYVRIRNSNPGDSVKGSLMCGDIEVATCTATVDVGQTDAECNETSTMNAQGLAKTCPAQVMAGNPNASDYTVNCDPPVQ